MPSKIITEEMKWEIREYYLTRPMALSKVSKKFNLSLPTVGKILKDIPKYPKAKIFNPDMDERFFENIDTEAKAYFLGLIITDGNVFIEDENATSNRQASISITLDLNDEYILTTFKEAVKTNTVIGHDGRGCGQIAVRSNLMAQDLAKYGVVPRKTLITHLPKGISDDMMPHLVRGILDGDGSVAAKMTDKGRFYYRIDFCGTHILMEQLSDYLTDTLNFKKKPSVYDYQDRHLSSIQIANIEDMYKFGEWVYKDATIFFTRKHDHYLDFKDHFNLK